MLLNFEKYHGAGNDFIMHDNRGLLFPVGQSIIKRLCNRNFGIGADGLILLENSAEHDFSMRYFNSDGHESSMCGNGGRCITAYAAGLGIINNKAVFSAIDGLHHSHIRGDLVSLKMSDVMKYRRSKSSFFLNTGSPHHVDFYKDISNIDVTKAGRKTRNSPRYHPNGCNVNFVEICSTGLKIRTYERGVEAETLACGTGATAAAIAAYIAYTRKDNIKVEALGGTLEVSFKANNGVFTDIWLTGPAVKVFQGSINTDVL